MVMPDWSQFQGNFFKLEQDKPATVVLGDWANSQSTFEGQDPKPCLNLRVYEHDGKDHSANPMSWQPTSAALISKLRPYIEKAEAEGKNTIKVQILKIGDKKNTQYSVFDPATVASTAGREAKVAQLEGLKKQGFLTEEGFAKAMSELDK